MKKIIILLLSLLTIVFAQNVMSITGGTGISADTISVSIDIENSDEFTGFQCDIVLPEQAEYVDGSAQLTSRADDHQMVATLKESGTLTLFAYSMSLTGFSGISGTVMTFDIVLGTVPGTYTLPLSNATIANSSSENILTGSVNGSFTIQAPDINVTPTSKDYGRVPLLQTSDRSFTIQNTGNADLTITSVSSDFSDFEVLGSSSFTITPGNSQSVTVRFHSNTKGTYNKHVTINSDDPDEPIQTVDLSVIAYAVNELDINNMFGRSGHVSEMTIDISNMEGFVGFSFDLDIPDAMTLVPGSAELTDRKTNHVVSATTLSNGNIRIVAYSASNETFTGNNGDVLSLDFMIDGQGGYYNINFIDPVIGDEEGNNIISDNYSGTLEIAAPDIYVNPSSLNYGNVSVFDTSTQNTTVYNYGSDTLNISSLIFYDPEFFSEQSLPLVLASGENAQIPVSFHNNSEGTVNSTMRIRSNDPDEDPTDLSLSATSFIPNIMRVDSTNLLVNDTGWISISIENHEPVVAFQCELIIPDHLLYADEVLLTARAEDHVVQANLTNSNTLSIFAYSLNQTPFSGAEGPVVKIKIQADDQSGYYPLILQNVIIGNENAENVMSSYVNNTISVLGKSGFTLVEGWNLISWNLDTENDSVPVLLSDILENVVVILGFDETGFTYDPSLPAFSTLQTMDHTLGYWIKTTQQQQISLIGSHVDADTPIPLKAGWNLISYLPHQADSLTHALSSVMDHVVVVLGFDQSGQTFDPAWPQFSNLKILKPGYGYWIKTSENCDLIYPNTTVFNE